MSFFKNLFGKSEEKSKPTDEEYNAHYELKATGLENVLGESHNIVGHAIIPFSIGGAVDMYYYTNGVKGTGFATMELIEPDGSGPIPGKIGTYELVAFTKLDYQDIEGEMTPFNEIERRFCGIFTMIGRYASQAKLQPNETCEVPSGENEPNKCLLFDEYKPDGKEFFIGDKKHGLLLIIEIFKDEMDYSRANGSEKLIGKLKQKGYYPYSDLDRKSVLED